MFFGPLTSVLHPHILLFCPWTWISKFACLFWFPWTIFILTVQFMLECPWSTTHSPGGVWCHWLWLSEHEILHFSFLFVYSTLSLCFCVFSYLFYSYFIFLYILFVFNPSLSYFYFYTYVLFHSFFWYLLIFYFPNALSNAMLRPFQLTLIIYKCSFS